jgi:hypothetical protein
MSYTLTVDEIAALCAVAGVRLTITPWANTRWVARITRNEVVIAEKYYRDKTKAARAAWVEYVRYLDTR